MKKVEVTKCENGYLIQMETSVHVVTGFKSHAALGKVIAEALGVFETKKERKQRTKKQHVESMQHVAPAEYFTATGALI